MFDFCSILCLLAINFSTINRTEIRCLIWNESLCQPCVVCINMRPLPEEYPINDDEYDPVNEVFAPHLSYTTTQ